MQNKHRRLLLIALILVVSLFYLFYGFNFELSEYFLMRRFPRLIAMIVVAISLTYATGLFQNISQNHILTPNILGYDRLFTFIQTTLVFVLSSTSILVAQGVLNFVVVASIMVIFSTLLYESLLKITQSNIFLLLLLGTIVATLFGSISTFITMVIDPNEFLSLQSRLIASFNTMNTEILWFALILLIGCIFWITRQVHKMDVIALGLSIATNLGIDVKHFQRKSLLVISLLISVSTSLVGPLNFLGLLVLNLVRQRTKQFHHKEILFESALVAIFLLIMGQSIIERVLSYSVTINVFVNLIGGTYMIYLLLKERTA